jgi:hypothetical protein
MPATDSTISAFAQFGLAGLVILALFYLVFTFINSQKQLHDSFVAQIQKQSESHANERKQWIETFEKVGDLIRTLSAQFEARLK